MILESIILVLLVFIFFLEDQQHSGNLAKQSNYKSRFPILTKSFNDLFEETERIPLLTSPGFELSPLPSFGAVNSMRDFIILDNLWVRQILVFDHTGRGKARIGSQGKGEGQYLFPDNMFYHMQSGHYYVYDGDLLRVCIFNEDFRYNYQFGIPLYLEKLAVTNDGRIFCYTSGAAGPQGIGEVIHECDTHGNILNKFCGPSKNYAPGTESKGGGIIIVENHIFVIQPYEYLIRKFDFRGKLIKQVQGRSIYYVPPSKPMDKAIEEDFQKRKEYHLTWSHILQIFRIGDKLIGIIFNQPNGKRIFLDVYDLDLIKIYGDIIMPDYIAGPHGILTFGNNLFMLRARISSNSEGKWNPYVIVYSLKLDMI